MNNTISGGFPHNDGMPRHRNQRRKRAPNGLAKPKHKKKNGRVYLEFSHAVPLWAWEKWPNKKIPQILTKTVTPDKESDGIAWQVQVDKEIENGTWMPDSVKREREQVEAITFMEYSLKWVESRKTGDGSPLLETTKHDYMNSLRLYLWPAFGNKPMRAITAQDIAAWYDGFRPIGYKADLEARRKHVYKHLRAFMNAAAREPWYENGKPLLDMNPCTIRVGKQERKHEPVRPSAEQLDEFTALLSPWVALAVIVASETGLRQGEVLGLRPQDIDFTAQELHVNRSVARIKDEDNEGHEKTVYYPPKTKKSKRTVPLSDNMAALLRGWIKDKHIKADAPLFTQPMTGKQAYGQNVRGAIDRARVKVKGLEKMNMHDLRRDFCSRVLENGGTIAEVMRLAGHTSLATATLYQIPDRERESKLIQNMSRVHQTSEEEEGEEPQTVNAGSARPVSEPARENPPASGDGWDAQGLAGYTDMDLAQAYGELEEEDRKSLLDALPPMRKLSVLKLYNESREG